MFSLNDSMRYWLYTEPTDMRKSFHTLSGVGKYTCFTVCLRLVLLCVMKRKSRLDWTSRLLLNYSFTLIRIPREAGQLQ